MNILIKGLEIPEEGYLDVRILNHGSVDAVTFTGSHPYCIAHDVVVLPEKHGDLIDVSALLKEFEFAREYADRDGKEYANAFRSAGGEISTEWWAVEDMVENAAVVVEAEGEE